VSKVFIILGLATILRKLPSSQGETQSVAFFFTLDLIYKKNSLLISANVSDPDLIRGKLGQRIRIRFLVRQVEIGQQKRKK
jgi:hypothetical protein